MADDEIVIGIRAAFDDFIGEFRKLTKDIARSSQDIQDSLNQAFDTKKAQANLKGLADEQKQTFQVIENYSKRASRQYVQNGVAITDFRGKIRGTSRDQGLITDSTNQASAAMEGFNRNINTTISNSPALRYALYDVANNLRNVAISAAALAVLPIGFSIKFERDFANVIRTSQVAGDEINALRADLIEIAQATPISWTEITRIATLAGQLNIAKEQIAAFTETVAQFAATTDVSVEGSATAFGRLDQLIDGIDGQFENLGSAILAVGVDSVATESQIIAVSTQIASMGNLAGLTAPEIIGLSGALSSLGIQPELARGTITRLFTEIGQAATTGGQQLEEFGRITGRSAAEFTAAWENEPSAVIQDFFDGINKEGPEAERTLRSLGITSVRDIPAILRLAQSSDEVRRLIALSNEEYAAGTKITEQYGIISSTVAEQLNRLVQNFEILAATIGDSVNPLSVLVGGLNAAVEGITAFVQIPAGQLVFGFGVAVAAVTALLAGYGAIIASVVAGIIAFRFAKTELGASFDLVTPKILVSAAAMRAFIAAATGAGTAAGGAAAKVGLFGKALSFAGPIGIALTAISAIGIAVSYFSQQAEDGEEKANRLGVSLEALGNAIEKDTTAFENGEGALRQYELSVSRAGDSLQTTAKDASDFLGAEEGAPEVIDATTDALERQTKALGENAVEFAKNQLLKDEDIRGLFADPAAQQAFIQAGGDPVDLLLAGLEGRSDEYINGLLTFYRNSQAALVEERKRINIGEEPGQEIGGPRYEEIGREIEFYASQAKILDGVLRDNLQAIGATKTSYDEAASSGQFFSDAQEGVAQKTTIAGDAIDDALNSLFQQDNFIKDVSDSITGLGDAFRTSGEEAFTSTGAIQNVIDTIANNAPMGDTNIILGNLGGLLLFLQTLGPAAAGGVSLVTNAITLLGGEAGYAADAAMELAIAQAAITGFDIAGAFNKIGSSAGGAAARVETLAEKFDKLVDSMFESINLGRDAEDAIFALGEAFGESGDQALYASDEMQDAIGAILKQSDSAEQGVANLAALFAHLAKTAGGQSAPSLQILRQAISQVGAQFGLSTAQVQQFIDTAGGGLANINLANFGLGVQNAQKEVRTLLDYASDLEEVFTRAFDIRFARTQALDDIAESFQNLAEQVEDARFELEELQASQSDLGADRGLKEYFLSIAEAYGDTLRAAQLRKEIAQLDREQAENQRRLEQAQQIAGGDLTTQGPGARQNRQALLGLVQNYQDYITALAESGASQDELRAATEQARAEFIRQATELGFQESVVLEYAAAFDDVRTAIDRVPRNITVEANVNPALQALNELNAALNRNIEAARTLNTTLGQPIPTRTTTTTTTPSYTVPVGGGKLPSFVPNLIVGTKTKPGALTWRPFYEGGFTGRGNAMDPAGIVHKGEYVVPKQYVNQSTGMPDPSFLAQLQNGMRGYQMGGFVGGSSMGSDGTVMVELSPYDRKLLADAGNVQLRLNGRVVAEATNQSNFNQARRGSD